MYYKIYKIGFALHWSMCNTQVGTAGWMISLYYNKVYTRLHYYLSYIALYHPNYHEK